MSSIVLTAPGGASATLSVPTAELVAVAADVWADGEGVVGASAPQDVFAAMAARLGDALTADARVSTTHRQHAELLHMVSDKNRRPRE